MKSPARRRVKRNTGPGKHRPRFHRRAGDGTLSYVTIGCEEGVPGYGCDISWGNVGATHSMVLDLTGATSITLHVTNNTAIPWTDYHIIFSDMTGSIDGVAALPIGTDIVEGQGTLDLFFNGAPLAPKGFFQIPLSLTYTGTDQEPAGTLGHYPTYAAVPEPASLALLGAGLPGLGLTRRRRAA